jgi:hypothetical protein
VRQLANRVHAHLDRRPVYAQHDAAEPRILVDVEMGAQAAVAGGVEARTLCFKLLGRSEFLIDLATRC